MCMCVYMCVCVQLCELLITATLRHEMPELEAEHGALMKQKAKNATEIMNQEEQVSGVTCTLWNMYTLGVRPQKGRLLLVGCRVSRLFKGSLTRPMWQLGCTRGRLPRALRSHVWRC